MTEGRARRTGASPAVGDGPSGPHAGGERCLNCGVDLLGSHCHRCGQEHRNPDPTLRELLEDFLEAALTWDSRVLLTLRHLLLHPGRVTAEYNAGRRARYVPPLRLYVVVSAIFLAAATLALDALFAAQEIEARVGTTAFETPTWLVRGFGWSMFLLVPAFAALLKPLHLRSGHTYVHHLVFAVHYHAFAFLLLTPPVLLTLFDAWLWPAWLAALAFLWIMVWPIPAIRRVYGCGWLRSAVEGMCLVWVYFSFVVPIGAAAVAGGVALLTAWI